MTLFTDVRAAILFLIDGRRKPNFMVLLPGRQPASHLLEDTCESFKDIVG